MVGVAALDYVRWTQLVPMFVAWSMLGLGLWLTAATFLQESNPDMGRAVTGALGLLLESTGLSEDGKVSVRGGVGELAEWLGPLWMVLALVGMVVARITPQRVKRLGPKTLAAKLLWAVSAVTIATSALCFAVFLTGYEGETLSFVLVFGLFAVAACGASIYSLTVSHVIQACIKSINTQTIGGPETEAASGI
jgi:hypothetical protein